MASSLLDRVKRPPQSAETFIAAADAAPASVAIPTSTSTPANIGSPETTAESLDTPSTAPFNADTAPRISRPRRATGEDPRKHDVPRYTFNLRLNDYELELLRSLAEERRDSMQKIIKNGLIPYLEGLKKK